MARTWYELSKSRSRPSNKSASNITLRLIVDELPEEAKAIDLQQMLTATRMEKRKRRILREQPSGELLAASQTPGEDPGNTCCTKQERLIGRASLSHHLAIGYAYRHHLMERKADDCIRRRDPGRTHRFHADAMVVMEVDDIWFDPLDQFTKELDRAPISH